MARPRGIDHFLAYLKGLETEYVVIGGGAAAILLEEQDLEFRKTKDVDLVLLTNGSIELNSRISQYVQEGKYQVKEATEGAPRYYRFQKPEIETYPEIIEIFARNEQEIKLLEGQYVIPIQNDSVAKISAILLDEEYFALIKANSRQAASGGSIVNALGNICLKARAHRELSERKAKGESVDEKDIRKHRNDILRIAVGLTGQERLELGPISKSDLKIAMSELRSMDAKQFKQVLEGSPGVSQPDLLQMLDEVFGL